MPPAKLPVCLLLGISLCLPVLTARGALGDSAAAESSRIYRSPEERRDAGLGRELLPWLKVSGLLEAERERLDFEFENNVEQREDDGTVLTLQVGLDITMSELMSAEITLETERDTATTSKVDEAILIIEFDPVELELGRLSAPFGEYYSHFIIGPLLEIGETVTDGAVLAWDINDYFELSVGALHSAVSAAGSGSLDWAMNLEFVNDTESIKLGLGYLSDLAESDEQLLSEFEGDYNHRVGAINAYALFGFSNMEITAEYVAATGAFSGFEAELDRPRAFNIEWAYFLSDAAQLALRYETSHELEDAPKSQAGINLTWRPNRYVLLSLEYLRARYARDFVFDDEDNMLLRGDSVAGQIAIEF
ncbi:MAG: LbtU family siderophore porin [Gammaproteobacteria bacterium]|nr:LbtU family siderophore porin [Gammaproteobacteria bacterium]